MPKNEDKCTRCGHTFFFHAPDKGTDKDRCWSGAVIGDSCVCPEFVPKVKP